MTWLVWRQYRAPGAIVIALLAVAATVILADGFQIASHWHSILITCSGNSACLQQQTLVNGVVSDLPYLCLIRRCGARHAVRRAARGARD